MSDLTYLVVSTDYVDKPKADDFVHADLLKQAINDRVVCCINQLIDRLNMLTGTDNQLKDEIVRLRMLHPEVLTAMQGAVGYASARAATTGGILLNGEQTVDDVALVEDDLCLVKDQTDPIENGVYRVSTTDWERVDPVADAEVVDGTILCWVAEGTENAFSSWAWLAEPPAAVGTDEQEWVLFHQEFQPTLSSDILDALIGTEGLPSAANRFVTDADARLDPFTDFLDGLVPAPGVSTTCLRFLCEDGSWAVPDEIQLALCVLLDEVNTMGPAGQLVFPGTIGITGLDTPVDPSDAATKGYVDGSVNALAVAVAAELLKGYGELFGAFAHPFVGVGAFEALAIPLAGPAHHFTPGPGGLVSDRDCVVQAIAHVSASTVAADTVTYSFAINGVPVGKATADANLLGGGAIETTTISAILQLSLGDVVELWARLNVGPPQILTITDCDLNVKE